MATPDTTTGLQKMKYKLLCKKRTSYEANKETKSDYKIITKHNKGA